MSMAAACISAISARRCAARWPTSPGCWRARAAPGTISCGPVATCATSIVITKRSTKSARSFTASRGWILFRLPPASRPSCAARNCWSRLKQSRCSVRKSRDRGTGNREPRSEESLMRTRILLAAVLAWAAGAAAQNAGAPAHQCECGAHPPGPPRDREVKPYAGEPADLSPYAKFAAPYDLNYTHPNIYSGAGREVAEPKDVTEVRIGFFGPIEPNPDAVFGQRMLHGAQLAVDEANANGGYGGKPFRLMLHNDYDNWQAKASYGYDRPTDPAIWGSASNEAVKMIYDDQDWAIFGSISSEATHIALRVALRAEIPIVNSASTDPTIPETYIPWYFTDLQDDRVQCLTLARRIFTELGLKRVAILRVNNRYGRFGVLKLRDASRRLGHPVVIEQKYMPGDTDFSHQLKVIQDSRTDAIVLWADQAEAAGILKQMQALGMKQRVF